MEGRKKVNPKPYFLIIMCLKEIIRKNLCILIVIFYFNNTGFSQVDTTLNPVLNPISEKSLNFIQKKYAGLSNAVDKQTIKLLERMQRRENKLRDKLACKDSSKAKELFDGMTSKYQHLQAKLQNPVNTSVMSHVN